MKFLELIVFSLILSSFILTIKSEHESIDFVNRVEPKSFLEILYIELENQIKDLTIQLSTSREQIKQLENKLNEQSLMNDHVKKEFDLTKEDIKSIKIQQNGIKSIIRSKSRINKFKLYLNQFRWK